MATVAFFPHVCGLTAGIHATAEHLRAAGHRVITPDFFDGATFADIDAGLAHMRELGFDRYAAWADDVARPLPIDPVLTGSSLGVMAAQRLAQTRPGAPGAILLEACLPAGEFGGWPAGLAAQVHGATTDEFFAGDGDLDAARELAATADRVDLFTYDGPTHLFTDPSLPQFDEAAYTRVMARVADFLAGLAPAD